MAMLTAGSGTATAHGGRSPGRAGGLRARARTWAGSTPGRLVTFTALLTALALAAGITGVVGLAQRAGRVDDIATRSGVLTVTAEELYRALSDADATAASAFLSNGVEPEQLRRRYEADIASAAHALAAAAAASDNDASNDAVLRISTDFPVYTGLVESARANNRQGYPVGAAYLRTASTMMRERMLPAADTLYHLASRRLAADRDAATGLPWLALPLALLTLAGLLWVHARVARHSRRLLNIGLAAAVLAQSALLGWIIITSAVSGTHLAAATHDGSAQVQTLTRARIAALQARTDESLTLVARGGGAAFEKDFAARMRVLAGPDGSGGLLAAARDDATDPAVRSAVEEAIRQAGGWRDAHRRVRDLDDTGRYPEAVTLAIGTDPASAGTAFTRLDASLARGLAVTDATFDRRVRDAAGAFDGAMVAVALFTLLTAAGIVVGLQRRIAEYR